MRRREFIALVGSAAVGWPLAARAQQPSGMRRVGLLINASEVDAETHQRMTELQQALQQLGWSSGHNIHIDSKYSGADPSRLPQLAKELVALNPDVIVAHTTPAVIALQKDTSTIPIVFVNVSDPIGSGFVASLPRPRRNITGVMLYEDSITGKWLAMLKEIAPNLARVALTANPKTTPYDYFLR